MTYYTRNLTCLNLVDPLHHLILAYKQSDNNTMYYVIQFFKMSFMHTWNKFPFSVTSISGIARPKLMVGPDYRGTKEVLENLPLAAPG